jgi:proline racemase
MILSTVEMHTGGEPTRIVVDGWPALAAPILLGKRRECLEKHDHLRCGLMLEPRGHDGMYGALLVEPDHPEADLAVLFMHNEGYSTMCGHAVIALARLAVELGWTPAVEPVTQVMIDAPAGLVTAYARVSEGRVTSTWFENVASFAPLLDQAVEVEGLGKVRFDLGFGGAFYAYVDAQALGLDLTTANARAIIAQGMAIKRAVMAGFDIRHPVEPDLGFLYGTIFTGPPAGEGVHSRHACVFADGALDRSPTGTGVAGRVAILHAKGDLDAGAAIRIESITGESFVGRVARATDYHGHAAVIPEVEGMAYITGRHDFLLEDGDPLSDGVFIR